ncbi:DUF2490 domain-containing protein [Hufsiella ginkgonis]|uniref:DUF2490 domain-containing protein n=1 Tax=Hufsiella ginkgonis TaxID=2695274 RepID=A0A7K1Y114_9SPHI|nr:DUF2490 domain-containing protein [Hufsiella ginkgonis]MXV16940.1 DUF2490 domain-containing protein [Hufsiella ginkgonis]
MRNRKFLVFVFLLFSSPAFAQQAEHSSWYMYLQSIKFGPHWGAHFDMQVRTGDDRDYIRNVLIRPGITYYLNKNQSLTLGYLLAETNRNLDGTANNRLTEHRAWEQFMQNHKIGGVFAAHRFRLEQRFIEQPAGDRLFSQRFRYFARFIVPLKKREQTFSKGFFAAVQNEVFLNLQNKSQLNNSVFDQNRFYLAGGYRISPKIDLEAGYLRQSVNGLAVNTTNHVIQAAVYTRF